jgi:hypothetical protein
MQNTSYGTFIVLAFFMYLMQPNAYSTQLL